MHRQLDYFGHNYEFSTIIPHEVSAETMKKCARNLVLVPAFLAQGGLNASKLAKLQAERRRLDSVRRLNEGATPHQRRNARVNALDSE